MKMPGTPRENYRPRPGWRPESPAVTAAELEAVVRSYPVVVIHLWAPWNGYDYPADQALQELRKEFEDRIHFRSFDIDTDPAEEEWPVLRRVNWGWTIPALACMVHGEYHESVVGLAGIQKCRDKLREWAELGNRPSS